MKDLEAKMLDYLLSVFVNKGSFLITNHSNLISTSYPILYLITNITNLYFIKFYFRKSK